jgi:molybdenum cofactor cytidylyltransferase
VSVTAVVLAAGAARRLGRPKQLEQVGGLPLLARAMSAAAPAENCLVMLGSGAALIRPTVQQHLPTARISVVGDWQRGMGHVLATAVSELPSRTEAIVVLLADQPFVSAAAVGLLIDTWRVTGEPWLCAGYDGRKGHPHLFDATWFPALATLDGDDGARAVTGDHRPYVVEVPGDDRDIDDESDLLGTVLLTGRHPADVTGARVNRSATESNSGET